MPLHKTILLILFVCLTNVSFAADGDEDVSEAVAECQKLILPTDYTSGRFTKNEQQIEQCLLVALPKTLIVEGNYHRVILNNGTIKSWESPDPDSEECQNDPCSPFFTFTNFIVEHDLVVLEVQGEEGRGFETISLETRESVYSFTLPLFSPSQQRFFALQGDLNCPYRAEIWNVSRKYAKKELEYSSQPNTCGSATWISDDEFIIQESKYVRSSTTGKYEEELGLKILFQFNGEEWVARETQ